MEKTVAAAFAELRRLEESLSVYRSASEWSKINRWAAGKPVRTSKETCLLLAECLEYSRQSEGAFDISVGPLIRAWGFLKGTGRLPGRAELAAARANVGYQHLSLDATALTVRFDREGVEINPGGIGKGCAVDRMIHIIEQEGFDTALVTASGSSIYGLGAPPEEPRGWPADIRDPSGPRETAATAFLKDMSLSTSGSFEKSFQIHGRTYSHILDPRTGCPARRAGSVSVVAPRTLDSEAWTKACFINGPEWTARRKPMGWQVLFCSDNPDHSRAWM